MTDLTLSRDGDIMVARDRRSAFVPEITDEVLAERMARFTPLVSQEGEARMIELPDPRRTAFTWDPKIVGAPVDFEELRTVETDHYCGYIAFFKPSIAEVLAQVPDDLPADCNAFLIRGDVECYPEGNGHRARTIFGRVRGVLTPEA